MATSNPQLQTIDTTPVELPTRLRIPQNRTDQIRAYIREEISRASLNTGHESFEESDDIEPDDGDEMPYSPFELHELEPATPLQNGVAAQAAPAVDPPATPEVPAPPAPQEVTNVKK
jgi:hypothetical protein